MSLFDHIAIAVDFSEPSLIAARAGLALAKASGRTEVTIIHAAQKVVRPAHADALSKELDEVERRIEKAALSRVEQMCAAAGFDPKSVHVQIAHGRPADVVPELAVRLGATVLVLGTHHHGPIARLVLGSVAEQILRRLTIPGLVACVGEDGVSPAEELSRLERLLVAIDGGPHDAVLGAALDLATGLGRAPIKISLVHVIDPMPVWAQPEIGGLSAESLEVLRQGGQRSATEELTTLSVRAKERGVDAEVEVMEGEAAVEIVELAKTLPAQVIVIGTRGSGGARAGDLGTTIHRLLGSAPVSVLVVPT
jgi:nucleotide-binding universal stress UspA family protein